MKKEMRKIVYKAFAVMFMAVMTLTTGCRHDEIVIPTEEDNVTDNPEEAGDIIGFYLVNEGNMGSNKCSLDYYDFTTGVYSRNIYAERNPNVVKELGDVGNDIAVYGSRVYIVVNCSHKVEVLDAFTGVRIGQVDIPNCRYIRFYKGDAYVSSYVGPVKIDKNAPLGAVYRFDAATLQPKGEVTVGYQPEEMEIIGHYMYVANSGGYRVPDYDNTVSVIDLDTFKEVEKIEVGINLHRVKKDAFNRLWINSRGDYQKEGSCLYVLERSGDNGHMRVVRNIPVACSNMAIHGDKLYYYATEWSNYTGSNAITYGIIDVRSGERISGNFITDGTDKKIKIPYGIAIHPVTGDIYVTDAKNYVSSGTLYCFDSEGKQKWSVRTGDIPAHLCFIRR